MARKKDEALAAARKQEILTASAVCFVRNGIHQASMRQICSEAQLSAGAVYNYFASKDAIIEAMAEQENREIQELSDYLASKSNKLKAIIQAVKWILEETSKEDAQLQIELMAEAQRNEAVRKHLDRNDFAIIETFKTAVTTGQDQSQITKNIKPNHLVQLITALYEGFMGRIAVEENANRKEFTKLAEQALTKLLAP